MRIVNHGLPLIEVNTPFRDILRLYAYASPPFLDLNISYPPLCDILIVEEMGGIAMEMSILYAIPRNEWLDMFFLGVTKVAGSYGQLWLVVGAVLLLFKKTRKTGIAVFVVAAVIAFSRLYMFLHFPTDVLAGILFGVMIGIATVLICDRAVKKRNTELE